MYCTLVTPVLSSAKDGLEGLSAVLWDTVVSGKYAETALVLY